MGVAKVRVLLSTYGSRGDVEPLVALAVRLRELGAEVRMCAPPDEEFAQRLAAVGVPLVPVGWSARALTTANPQPSSLPQRAAELIANQFDVVMTAAEGCDVLVATGVTPAIAGALSVAEKLGIRSVSVTFQQLTLPSPDRPPLAYPGRPLPPDATDNRVLWDMDAESNNVLFGTALNTNRASIGLPPVLHHGGQGTTTTVTRSGSPQVVVPQGTDQPYWAGRVADLGIGVAHEGPTPTIESLSTALKTVLTRKFGLWRRTAMTVRSRASAVAGAIRTDGAAVAAKLLLEGSC